MINDDVPSLEDEEQAVWRAFLRAHHILRERLDQQMQRDAGMPVAYDLILAVLSEQPDRTASMTGLARATQYSPSRLSHAVRKMAVRFPAPASSRAGTSGSCRPAPGG